MKFTHRNPIRIWGIEDIYANNLQDVDEERCPRYFWRVWEGALEVYHAMGDLAYPVEPVDGEDGTFYPIVNQARLAKAATLESTMGRYIHLYLQVVGGQLRAEWRDVKAADLKESD